MIQLLKISPIFFVLILFAVNCSSIEWTQSPPEDFEYLAGELQKSFSDNYVICQIVTAAYRNNLADDVRYVIILEVEVNGVPTLQVVEAHFVFRGNPAIRIDFVREYGSGT